MEDVFKLQFSFFLSSEFILDKAPWQYTKIYSDNDEMTQPQRVFAGMVTALDEAVGELVQGLKDSGLWENTLLYFSNDNGRDGNEQNARGGKFNHYFLFNLLTLLISNCLT